MIEDEFRNLAEVWGADVTRWPGAVQGEAKSFAATRTGQDILAEMISFDNVLLAVVPDVSDRRAGEVRMRVLLQIAQEPENGRRGFADAALRWFMPSAGLAMAAGLGVAAAILVPPPGVSSEGAVLISAILDSGTFAADFAIR
jgi:hypothetical protein